MSPRNSGQSMIETIVAVAVISIGLVAAAALASYSIRSGVRAENRLTATYLAQSIIEQARVMRESNVLSDEWAFQRDINITGNYTLNYDARSSDSYPFWFIWRDESVPMLLEDVFYSEDLGIYSNKQASALWTALPNGAYRDQAGFVWRPTNFRRHLEISDSGNPATEDDYRRLKAVVNWVEPGGVEGEQVIETILYDWY